MDKPIIDKWFYLYIARLTYLVPFTIFCARTCSSSRLGRYWSRLWFLFGFLAAANDALLILNNTQTPIAALAAASLAVDGLSIACLVCSIEGSVLKCTIRSCEELNDDLSGYPSSRSLKRKAPVWLRRMRSCLYVPLLCIAGLFIASAVYEAQTQAVSHSEGLKLHTIQHTLQIVALSVILAVLLGCIVASVLLIGGPGIIRAIPLLDPFSRVCLFVLVVLTLPAAVVVVSTLVKSDYTFGEYIGLRGATEFIVVVAVTIHIFRIRPRIEFNDEKIKSAYWEAKRAEDPERWDRAGKEMAAELAKALRGEPEAIAPEPEDLSRNMYFRISCIDAEDFLVLIDEYGTSTTSGIGSFDLRRYLRKVPVTWQRYPHTGCTDENQRLEDVLLPKVRGLSAREDRIAAIYAHFISLQFAGDGHDLEKDHWITTALNMRSQLTKYKGCVDWPWKPGKSFADLDVESRIAVKQAEGRW